MSKSKKKFFPTQLGLCFDHHVVYCNVVKGNQICCLSAQRLLAWSAVRIKQNHKHSWKTPTCAGSRFFVFPNLPNTTTSAQFFVQSLFSEQFVHSCQVRKLGHFLTLFPLQCHQTARHFYWCCQFTSQSWSSTVIASVDKISFFQLSTIVSIIPRMLTGLCEYFQGFWLIDCLQHVRYTCPTLIDPWFFKNT